MLKQRIITALVIAPPVIAGFFFLTGLLFALFIGVIVLVAAWEFGGLAGFEGAMKIGYSGLLALFMLGAYFLEYPLIIQASVAWWLLALLLVLTYPDSSRYWSGQVPRAIMGVLVLIPAWISLIQLKSAANSTFLLLMLLFLIWGADIGAYFTGRAFGKRKLAPRVSPGKSWAGVAGGVVTAMAIVMAAFFLERSVFDSRGWLVFSAISVVVVLVSVLGDLTESMLKRHRGIKDSSGLLPGHGGVMDRIDSLVAAGPVFVFGLMATGLV